MAGKIENLKPFVKGQSGNPAGRKKGTAISGVLNRMMDEVLDDGMTRAEKMAFVICREAEAGDFRFMQMLLDRTEGKVAEVVLTEFGPDEQSMAALEVLRERRANRGST